MTATLNGTVNHAPLRLTSKTLFDGESIVAAGMLYRSDCRGAITNVAIDTFADPIHRAIAAMCLAALDNGEHVDVNAIAIDLRKAEIDTEPAILQRLAELADMASLAQPASVRGWVNRLNERTANMAMSRELERVKLELDGGSLTVVDAAGQIEAARSKHAPPATAELLTLAGTMSTDPADDVGELIKSGTDWLDAILPAGGFVPGDKIAIGGAPGHGKSAFALFVVLMTLITNKSLRCVWALGEMAPKTLRNRSLQVLSGLTIGALRRPWSELSPVQTEAKHRAIATLRDIGNRMFIVDAPLTPRKITTAVEAKGAGLLVVDYLQLCRPDTEAASRREAVDDVVRALTTLSQRTGVVSMWLSAMPKSALNATDVFSAFKESSEIAHAVDLAYLVKPAMEVGPDEDLPDVLDTHLRCLKARHGSPLSIVMRFDRCSQQFTGYPKR